MVSDKETRRIELRDRSLSPLLFNDARNYFLRERKMRLVIALTGASGIIYGIRLLEILKDIDEIETHLILSDWAKQNIRIETSHSLDDVVKYANYQYDVQNLAAPVASGSFKHDGMVIIPCSMKTLSAVASGYSSNLIQRAADVSIKEQRKVVLAVRETPLSVIHLENMLKLARLGVSIMPPIPAFYGRNASLKDIVDHFIGRVLDQFNIDHENLIRRWGNQLS